MLVFILADLNSMPEEIFYEENTGPTELVEQRGLRWKEHLYEEISDDKKDESLCLNEVNDEVERKTWSEDSSSSSSSSDNSTLKSKKKEDCTLSKSSTF